LKKYSVTVRKRCIERVIVEANSRAEALRKAKDIPSDTWELRLDRLGENPVCMEIHE
jgi:hypothetical protein